MTNYPQELIDALGLTLKQANVEAVYCTYDVCTDSLVTVSAEAIKAAIQSGNPFCARSREDFEQKSAIIKKYNV